MFTRSLSCIFATLVTVLVAPLAQAQLSPAPVAYVNTTAQTDAPSSWSSETAARIQSDQAGSFVVVFETKVKADGDEFGDTDIGFVRSIDNGASWSAIGFINSNHATDAVEDKAPQIATDGAGTWGVVWVANHDLAGNGIDSEIFVSRSSDNGATWSSAALLNSTATTDGDAVDDQPFLAMNTSGRWVAVWRSNYDNGGLDVDVDVYAAVSEDAGLTWSPPVIVAGDAATTSGSIPQVAVDASGNAVAVWLAGTNVRIARSSDGLSWTDSGSRPNRSQGPYVGVTPDGLFLLHYQYSERRPPFGTWYLSKNEESHDQGATWQDSSLNQGPYIVLDRAHGAEGTEVDVDIVEGDGDTDLYLTQILAEGQAQPRHFVGYDEMDDLVASDAAPDMVTDGKGVWIAVWESDLPLDASTFPDRDIVFARSLDNGATWSAPALLSRHEDDATELRHDAKPVLASNGDGTWVCVWREDYSAFNSYVRVSRSTDDGLTWSASEHLSETSIAQYAGPRITGDGACGMMVVWPHRPSNSSTNVFAAASNDDGHSWGAAVRVNSVPAANDSAYADTEPDVATDEQGRWLVVWLSSLNMEGGGSSDFDVFCAHSDDLGNTWSPYRKINHYADSDSAWDDNPVVTYGAGGWIVLWDFISGEVDGLSENVELIRAKSIDGGITWSGAVSANNRWFVDEYGFDQTADVATDGRGTWVAVWSSSLDMDGSGRDYDILATYSMNNGASWLPTMVLNSNAVEDTISDVTPRVSTDGAGNWVVVWESGFLLADPGDQDIKGTHFTLSPGIPEGEEDSAPCVMGDGEGVLEGDANAEGEGIEDGADGEGLLEGTAEGTPDGVLEGGVDGASEGIEDGTSEEGDGHPEGNAEGAADGDDEGAADGEGDTAEGNPDGDAEGAADGGAEGVTDGDIEGAADGDAEGHPDGEGGAAEGETISSVEVLLGWQGADANADGRIDFSEFAGAFGGSQQDFELLDANASGMLSVAEQQLLAGADSPVHSADLNSDGAVGLGELLRLIQLYNALGYACAWDVDDTEDGFVTADGGAFGCPPHAADYEAGGDWKISLGELLRVIQFYNLAVITPCEGSEDGFCAIP